MSVRQKQKNKNAKKERIKKMTNYETMNNTTRTANANTAARGERARQMNAEYAAKKAAANQANARVEILDKEKETEDNSLVTIWATIRFICHFLPILTSIAMLIAYTCNPSNFVADYILMPIAFIGWIAAIIAKPFGIIKSVFSISWKVFKFFFFMPVFLVSTTAAIAAGIVSFGILTMIAVFAPAVFTIILLIKEMKE